LKPSPLNMNEQRVTEYHRTLGVHLVSTVPHLRGIACAYELVGSG